MKATDISKELFLFLDCTLQTKLSESFRPATRKFYLRPPSPSQFLSLPRRRQTGCDSSPGLNPMESSCVLRSINCTCTPSFGFYLLLLCVGRSLGFAMWSASGDFEWLHQTWIVLFT
ncbi:hypothetical protein SAY86_031021 [Trapa natans]|uniref:Uncharacterized protein n=1 Tax=Trapa natans TaxID=22666 RepID=A0AAN7RE27_TRANT|nr:hypothetical protein SAY86_031021 [Trapa natans]